VEVTDRAQLDDALDTLLPGPAARPLIAYLVGGAGALGLGLDPAGAGLLLFAPADRRRAALHSVGPAFGVHDHPVPEDPVFSVNGRPHRFSARCLVPAQSVRAAAAEYLATGTLPTCVMWEPEPAQPAHHAEP
jgi:hypothetical protein